MKTIKLLDSKFELNQFSTDAILAQADAIKLAKKFGIDYYSNIEYHQEFGYFNFTIESGNYRLQFQVTIKEREIYYRYPENIEDYNKLPASTLLLIGLLSNHNAKCNKFFTNDAVMIMLSTIDQTLR